MAAAGESMLTKFNAKAKSKPLITLEQLSLVYTTVPTTTAQQHFKDCILEAAAKMKISASF
jgi:hypothetical protein